MFILRLFFFSLFIGFSIADSEVGAFYEWCGKNQIEFPKIKIEDIEGYGRGVVATEEIKAGELVLRVPNSAIVTPTVASDKTESGNALGDILDPYFLNSLSDTHLMALFILHERTSRPNSKWAPFLRLFPEEFDTPIFWGPEEQAWLEGSALLEFTRQRQAGILRHFKNAMTELQEEFPEIFPPSTLSLSTFAWALSAVWSRSFAVKIDDMPSSGLVPFADLFNFHPHVKVTHSMTDEGLELVAKETIAAGEQIFVPYGRQGKSNGELLLEYGFVEPANSIRSTLFAIPPLAENDPLYPQKLEFLETLQLPRHVTLGESGFPADLVEVERVRHLTAEEIELLTSQLPRRQRRPLTARNEQAALRTAVSHLKRNLAEFPAPPPTAPLTTRAGKAQQLRWEESKLLQSAVAALEEVRSFVANEAGDSRENVVEKETISSAEIPGERLGVKTVLKRRRTKK